MGKPNTPDNQLQGVTCLKEDVEVSAGSPVLVSWLLALVPWVQANEILLYIKCKKKKSVECHPYEKVTVTVSVVSV